jgi:TolA-binding protein
MHPQNKKLRVVSRLLYLWIAASTAFVLRAQVPDIDQSKLPDALPQGEQWLSNNGYHAARQQLEEIYTLLPSVEARRDALFILLKSSFEDQEYENAYQWSSDFLFDFPNDRRKREVLLIRGICAFQTERTDAAYADLDAVLRLKPEGSEARLATFWRAMCSLEDGDWQSAESDLRSTYEDSLVSANGDIVLMGMALSYERRHEYRSAIDVLERFLIEFPRSRFVPDAKIRLASLYLRLGSPEKSVEVLENVKPSYPQRQEYMLIKAEGALQADRFTEAENGFSSYVKSFPRSKDVRNAQYGLAWSLVQQGKYKEALIEFDTLGHGSDSMAFAALYESAILALLNGNPMEAVDRFDTLTQVSPYDLYAEKAYYQMGLTHYRAKRYREARRAFQLAARLFPESKNRTLAYRMLGESNVALGDFSNAQYAFGRVRQLNAPTDLAAPSMYKEGICLYHLGRFKSSADLFNNLLKTFPKHDNLAEVYVWRGEALYQDGRYGEAEKSFTDALNLFPENPKKVDAAYGRAWCLFEQKKFNSAAVAFNSFSKNNPQDDRVLDATLREADCYFFLGDYEKSSSLYASLADLKKNSRYAEYADFQIAMSYVQRGESERGIEQLRNFMSKYPSSIYNEVVRFNVAWTYFSKNQFNEAIGDFRILMGEFPQSQLMPRVLFNMGDAFYNLRQYDSARVYYQRVPKEYPQSPLVADALTGLQYTYEAEGRPTAAVAQIDTLLRSSQTGISQEELLLKKGDILFGQGEFGGAVIEYNKILSLNPNRAVQGKAYYQLARAYEMENNIPQAVKYYETVLKDYTDLDFAPNAVLALGIADIKAKRYREAVAVFIEFETKFPNSPLLSEVRYNQGVAYVNMKEKNDAVSRFTSVIEKHPEDIFADRSRLQLSRILLGNKQYRASLDTLNSVISRRSDDIAAEALLLSGENYLSMKKPEDALQTFRDVYEQYTEFPMLVERAHLGAGECYERLKKVNDARLHYEEVVASGIDPVIKKDAQERLRRLR